MPCVVLRVGSTLSGSDVGAAATRGALQGCITLAHLHFANNLISDLGFLALARGVLTGSLKLLDLRCNPVGGAGIHMFAEVVATDPGELFL